MPSLLTALSVRKAQGRQYIADLRAAAATGFRARPVIADTACASGCNACTTQCPTQAVVLPGPGGAEVGIDLGACVMCGECAPVCPENKIRFSSDVRLCATTRSGLVVTQARAHLDPVAVSAELHQRFGRSLKLRSVSSGGCNGCEMEINALSNVNFDLGRYGIDMVASPRHADALVLSGPLTRNMAQAVRTCWEAMPAPKFVIAVGACAISGGVFQGSSALERSFLDEFPPSLYVPGCPAHPLTFITGILDLLGIDR
jgi:Ni,Fe-hydrogenase III small subunit/NAD-dependent dihydropyrimidine dehydrogenase PreA subunit